MSVVLELVETPTEDVRALIAELETELSRQYPAEQRHGYSAERVFQPNIRFFVARLDGQPVGCGGVEFADGFAELKRMYVRPAHRGRQVGRAILDHLEEQARIRGVDRVVLETGDVLHAALRLYERAGFTRCGPFGAFIGMPPAPIERSVFLEKRIAATSPASIEPRSEGSASPGR